MTRQAAAILMGASLIWAVPALAADHLFNAQNAPGADQRAFDNPVTANPGGQAVQVSKGNDAPGEGNPKVGEDQGTPAVETEALNPTAKEHVPFGE